MAAASAGIALHGHCTHTGERQLLPEEHRNVQKEEKGNDKRKFPLEML